MGICPFLSPLSSGSLINVSAIHHHETGIIGWVINYCLLWELWSVYLKAQESHLIVDIFVHMLTAHDSPVIPAAPCLRLSKPYIIAFTLSQETFNASLSGQQYKSGSFVFHLRKKCKIWCFLLLNKIQITEFSEGSSRRYIWLCGTAVSMMWWLFLSFVWTEDFSKDHFVCTDAWLLCEQEWLFGCCCNWKLSPTTGQSLVQSPCSPAFPHHWELSLLFTSSSLGSPMHHLNWYWTNSICCSTCMSEGGGVEGTPLGTKG